MQIKKICLRSMNSSCHPESVVTLFWKVLSISCFFYFWDLIFHIDISFIETLNILGTRLYWILISDKTRQWSCNCVMPNCLFYKKLNNPRSVGLTKHITSIQSGTSYFPLETTVFPLSKKTQLIIVYYSFLSR